MKRATFVRTVPAVLAMWLFVGTALLVTPGCEKPTKAQIVQGLILAGDNGAHYGLREWGKKDPASAKECATALRNNINDVLIPYLSGGKLPSSAEVQAMINSSLFKNVKEEVKQAIVLAALALDLVLPIPATDKYLTQDQVDYCKAFLNGISTGCQKYLDEVGAKNPLAPIEGNWIK